MNKLRLSLVAFLAALGVMTAPVLSTIPVAAAGPTDGSAATNIGGGLDAVGGDKNKTPLDQQIKVVVNMLLFILGAIAVIVIIIGGIRYALSNGDPGGVKTAKDTVLYAVIGLIVAILAYAIVNFVVNTAFGGK